MTNDGYLAFRLMHPRFGVDKTYLVQVLDIPRRKDLQRLLKASGLKRGSREGSQAHRVKTSESTWLRIVLNEGKIAKSRMLAKWSTSLALKRIAIAGVQWKPESGKAAIRITSSPLAPHRRS